MSHTSPWTQWGGVLNRPCQNQDVLRRISLGSPSGMLRDPLEIRDDVKMRKVEVFVKNLIDEWATLNEGKKEATMKSIAARFVEHPPDLLLDF